MSINMDKLDYYITSLDNFYYTYNRFYHIWAKQYGLTSLSLLVLYIISNNNNCTQHLITEKLSVPKQTVCSILDNFEKGGYILKNVDERDKRNKIISFTDKGLSFFTPILEELKKLDIELINCLTEEEIENYLYYQSKVVKFMNNYFIENK